MYGNPNATQGYFGGKSHSHWRLVKQRLRVNKDENGKRKLFLYPCCLKNVAQINCHVPKFEM